MNIRLGNVDIAMGPDDRDCDASVTQRISLPSYSDGDATDVREGHVCQKSDVHPQSVRA